MIPAYKVRPDGELAGLALSGNDAAFAELVRRHSGPLYKLIVHNVGDRDEALDLLQEAFVSAYRALGRYDQGRPMRPWLSLIALNKCRDWARRRAVRRLLHLQPAHSDAAAVAEDRPGPDVAAADRDEMDRLRRAISTLPTSLREPLILHTIEGMTQAETASLLSISEKAVETRLRRARIKLNEMLSLGPA